MLYKKFRLPRKIKKKIKRGLFLYPADKSGGSLMGDPKRCQEDYDAYKQGILKNHFKKTKAQQKVDSIAWDKKYRTPAEITDEELLKAVNEVFAQEYREKAYKVLSRAKKHPVAIDDYHIFVNAYNQGEHNVCCMTLDSAENDLMRSKPRKIK